MMTNVIDPCEVGPFNQALAPRWCLLQAWPVCMNQSARRPGFNLMATFSQSVPCDSGEFTELYCKVSIAKQMYR